MTINQTANFMKKFIYISAVISAVFAFSACQKEISVIEEPEELVTITFTADKVAETKTAANEGENSVSYTWTEGDENRIKLFTVGIETEIQNEVEVEKEVLTEVANATATIDYSTNKMSITASVAPNATYTFRAVFCDPDSYTGSGTNYGERKPKIKAEQYPDGTNSFDPSADILVTDDMEVAVGAASEGGETATTGSMLMTFHRKVVINKMTLKNLSAGEKVEKVVITSLTNGGDIQGYLHNGEMAGQSKSITIKYPGGEVAEGGQFPVYFVSMAASGIALKIDVTTDQNTYSKSFASGKSISLYLGQFTRFGFALPEGVPVTELPNGDYFITGVKDTDTYAATAYATGNNLSNPLVITVDEDNETIENVTGIEDCVFTFTRITNVPNYNGKYTIQDANGLYLYAAGGSSSNQLKGEDAPDSDGNAYWSVSKNNDGTYSIESAGSATRNKMRFNSSSTLFSCYGSGQEPITLYPASWCNIDTTPVLTLAESERTKSVTFDASSVVFNYTKNRYASTPDVQVTSDFDNIISGTPVVSNNTITVSLVPNTESRAKTATLSVSSTGLASPITLTISQEAFTTYEYVKITETSDDMSGDYVIVATSGANNYALPTNPTVESGKISGQAVTISNNTISSTNAEGLVWTITKTNNGYYTITDGTKKIYHSNGGNSGTDLAYGNSTSYFWSFTTATGGTGLFKVAGVSSSNGSYNVNTRGLLATNGGVFGGYALSNFDNSSYAGIDLYKKVVADTRPAVATPSFSESGAVASGTSVTISCSTSGATIYYTTGSSDFSAGDWTEYAGPISITTACTVKAIATKNNHRNSEVASAYYTIITTGPVTVSMSSFSSVSGYVQGDSNISYLAEKGGANNAPAINNNVIRIYQNGGLLTVTANNNKKLKSVTIGSSMATKVQVKVDDGSFSSDNNIAENGTYTKNNINATSVVFKCTGTTKDSRLYLNYLSVTYE